MVLSNLLTRSLERLCTLEFSDSLHEDGSVCSSGLFIVLVEDLVGGVYPETSICGNPPPA